MYAETKETQRSLDETIAVMDLIRDEIKVRELLSSKQTYAGRVALTKLLRLLIARRHNKLYLT